METWRREGRAESLVIGEPQIVWTEYMRSRAELRGFALARIEQIVRYSTERYLDRATGRLIAVGKQGAQLLLVPYETDEGLLKPVTAHVATRK